MNKLRKALSLLLICTVLLAMTGCHGSRGLDAFEMPETFDTARDYEITFCPRTTPTKPRPGFMSRPLPILKRCIRISR